VRAQSVRVWDSRYRTPGQEELNADSSASLRCGYLQP
jgi:hypothetical protein